MWEERNEQLAQNHTELTILLGSSRSPHNCVLPALQQKPNGHHCQHLRGVRVHWYPAERRGRKGRGWGGEGRREMTGREEEMRRGRGRLCKMAHSHHYNYAHPPEHWWTSRPSILSILGILGPHKSTSSSPTCTRYTIQLIWSWVP